MGIFAFEVTMANSIGNEPKNKISKEKTLSDGPSTNMRPLYPKLDTRISVRLFVTLVLPPLDTETSWSGELWSKTNILNWPKNSPPQELEVGCVAGHIF